MNPLDRIAQLTEENRQLLRSVDELRAQVETARQEIARDSATIAKLAKDKQEILEQLFVALCFVEDCEHSEDYKPGIVTSRLKAIRETISRHA